MRLLFYFVKSNDIGRALWWTCRWEKIENASSNIRNCSSLFITIAHDLVSWSDRGSWLLFITADCNYSWPWFMTETHGRSLSQKYQSNRDNNRNFVIYQKKSWDDDCEKCILMTYDWHKKNMTTLYGIRTRFLRPTTDELSSTIFFSSYYKSPEHEIAYKWIFPVVEVEPTFPWSIPPI